VDLGEWGARPASFLKNGPVTAFLSPVTVAWIEQFEAWRTDASLRCEYDDFGTQAPGGIRQAFEATGLPDLRLVLVSNQDVLPGCDELAGLVSWHARAYGPNTESRAWAIGVSLRPEYRARGIGTVAHRLLVRHLLSTTDAHRLEAGTDVTNAPERAALTRVGFRFEGLLRGAQHRRGKYHDIALYGLLRGETHDTG
jgi:RimJ/RimL family protein N-acetyltransferase